MKIGIQKTNSCLHSRTIASLVAKQKCLFFLQEDQVSENVSQCLVFIYMIVPTDRCFMCLNINTVTNQTAHR